MAYERDLTLVHPVMHDLNSCGSAEHSTPCSYKTSHQPVLATPASLPARPGTSTSCRELAGCCNVDFYVAMALTWALIIGMQSVQQLWKCQEISPYEERRIDGMEGNQLLLELSAVSLLTADVASDSD